MSRRTFLRRSAGVSVAVPAIGLLEACGGDDDDEGTAAGNIALIKGPFSDNDLELARQLERPFERRNPEIDVKTSLYDWTTFETELTTAFAGDNPPDVPYLTVAVWPRFARDGALEDLTDRVRDPSYESEFQRISSDLWTAGTLDDKIYAVPWVGGIFPIYANLDLLEEAGVTNWNESYDTMRAAARATRKGNVFGFGMATSFATFSYQDWLPYIHGAGGSIFNEDGSAGGLDTPGSAEAWDFLQSLYQDGYAAPAGQYDFEGLRALFQAGRCALCHEQVDFASILGEEDPGFRYEIFEPPPGPAGPSGLVADYGYLTVAAKSEAKDAAWEYVRYLASAPTVSGYVQDLDIGFVTARDDTPEAAGDNPYYQKAQEEMLPRAKPLPAHPRGVDALRAASNEFERCLSGEKSGAEAIRSANDRITELASS